MQLKAKAGATARVILNSVSDPDVMVVKESLNVNNPIQKQRAAGLQGRTPI